jgi:putative transposase
MCLDMDKVTYRRKLKRFEEPGHARYLTCSCYHQLPLFGNNRIKDAFAEQLAWVRRKLNFALYAWVVMPEHFHLLIAPRPPDLTVTDVLLALKRPFAAKVLVRWRELDAPILTRIRDAHGKEHFWQRGGGYDRNIFTDRELQGRIQYIHYNPVRRALVKCAEQWVWSSAHWYEGLHDGKVAIDPIPL